MHVGLIAAALLLAAAALRVARRQAVILTIAATWVYLLVIGPAPSAIRSGIMITLVLLAGTLQRPSAPAPIIAAAALAILAFQPLAILDAGFQLSFGGILGILFLRAPLLTLAPDALHRRTVTRSLVDAFAVGIAASAVTAPIVAHHFGVFSPIAIPATIPAIPLMSLALVGAVAALLSEPIVAPLAVLLADGAGVALDLLNGLARLAAAVPYGNVAVPSPPWWSWIAAATAGLFGAMASQGRRRLRLIVGSGATAVVLVIWPLISTLRGGSGIEVHFIDVGQGDAIAIRTPHNHWVVVDTGPSSDSFDAGERLVLPFLLDQGARHVDVLILTHPHLDHIGGARAVMEGLPVRIVFDPGHTVEEDFYLHLLQYVNANELQWSAARSGRTLQLDEVSLEFLWPDAETVDVLADANQISAVVRLSYGDFALLLTGDAGVEVEERLVDRHGADLEADILKLGHHGSATSTSELLLATVDPELAVVSAGRRNRYGHPAPSVMQRVEGRGIEVARTDADGTVTILVAPGGTSWRREEW
jgi:competence protein ComEC